VAAKIRRQQLHLAIQITEYRVAVSDHHEVPNTARHQVQFLGRLSASEDAFNALKLAEERADPGLVCARTQVNPGGSAHALMMAQVAVALG